MFQRILICLDGSKLAEQVLPYAIEHALRFNSILTLLHVIVMPESEHPVERGISAGIGDVVEAKVKRRESEIQDYLDGIGRQMPERGIVSEHAILPPSPAGDAIVSYARDNQIDLTCIATHGHSGLDRAAFGSVADHVIRESGTPVLVIRPQKNIAEKGDAEAYPS